jgi:hypothetical protein
MIARIKNSAPLKLYAKYFSTPRARNDYATHIPILIGLARMREIRNVLEFGCGYYSTFTFLNASAFPHLERLQSVENDVAWAEMIRESAQDDRWNLKLVDGGIANAVSSLDLETFDLILIDDSRNSEQRSATIRSVASRQPQRPWIVIHDFEVEEYRRAASGFKKRHAFTAYNPETGLVCNQAIDVRPLASILKSRAKTLEPDDLDGWLNCF